MGSSPRPSGSLSKPWPSSTLRTILNRKAACLLDFAEVLALADRSAEGIALIERAVDLYRLKENDVGAARAQALLAAAI